MAIDLYYMPGSPPCHAVQMTAKAVGVDLNLIFHDIMAGEHMKPEFMKLIPQHTIPAIVDNGYPLSESRAIQIYLVEKYGKTDSLYPKCPQTRAVINQRLFFDIGTLYQRFSTYFYPQFLEKAPANPDHLKKVEEALDVLEAYLQGQTYAAGDSLTVADISLAASVSTIEMAGIDLSKYPNITKWLKTCKSTIPGYEINEAGLAGFRKYIDENLSK